MSFPRRREPRHHILPFSFWVIGSSPTPWTRGKCNDRGYCHSRESGNPAMKCPFSRQRKISGLSGQARPHGHGASVMTGGGMSFPRKREPRHHPLQLSFCVIGSSPTPWTWGKCNDRGVMSFPFYLSFPRRRESSHHTLQLSFWFIGSSPTPWTRGKCNDRCVMSFPFFLSFPRKREPRLLNNIIPKVFPFGILFFYQRQFPFTVPLF
jgi:hypothetical protein